MHTGIIVETFEGKNPLGKPRCKRENNIKLCVKEVRKKSLDSMHMSRIR
jgi:hypothetical protein